MNKKRIVILSTGYYPDMSPPSACIDKYLQAMKKRYEICVITVTYQIDFTPFSDPDISVYYVSNLKLRLRNYCENNIRKNRRVLLSKFLVLVLKAETLIMFPFRYPTVNKWEIGAYYNALLKMQTGSKIDIVISVSHRINSQFAALKFKRKFPDVQWITFFVDPFTDLFIYYKFWCIKPLRKWRNHKNELRIYNTADYNLLIEDIYNRAIKRFPQLSDKIFCIKYIMDDIRSLAIKKTNARSENYIKMIYAGSLYETIRNPEFALSVISEIRNVILDMYVRNEEGNRLVEKYTFDNVHFHKEINHSLYIDKICNECDILINIGNSDELQMPSKIFDLLATGRPILNFYFIKDSQYNLIERYPLGLNIGIDEKGAVEKASEFCFKNAGKQLAFDRVERLFPEHTLRQQVDFLESLISN